jgi:predicted RNA-binding Zn-ribbon protein involved in translation (DUF1610 family)
MTQAKQFTCPCCGNKSDHLDYEEEGTKLSYFTCDGEYRDDPDWTNTRHLYHCPQCFEVLALSEEQAKQLFKPKAKKT